MKKNIIKLGGKNMFEYKVIKTKVDNAEREINELAKDGWRVINASPNIAMGYGLVIILEKENTGF